MLQIIIIVITLVMVVSSNDNTNYAMELYTLASKIHSNVHTNNTSNKNVKIHLIRVPKASSTSLSVVARRIVGCTPPGNITSNNT